MLKTSAELRSLYPDQYFYGPEIAPEILIFNPLLATFGADVIGDAPALRVPYVVTDPSVGFVPEGDEIPKSDPTLNEIEVRTGKLATIAEISKESVQNSPGGSGMLAASQQRALAVQANRAFLTNTTAGYSTGINNGVLSAGEVTTNLDAIGDAVTSVEINGGNATAIVIDPAGLGRLRVLKEGTTSARNLIQVDGAGNLSLFGVPVIKSAQMPARTGLVVDSSDIIAAYGNIELERSDEAGFTRDTEMFKLKLRLGWKKIHPARHSGFTFAAGE